MSVERRDNGSLRLACDGEWCAKKFSPKTSRVVDPAFLRERAADYGWRVEPLTEKFPQLPGVAPPPSAVRDLCPICRRAVAPAVAS